MASLYELAQETVEAIEAGFEVDPDTGEVSYTEDQAKAMEDLDEKLGGYIAYIKSQTALANAIKAEEKALECRRKAVESRVTRLKEYIGDSLHLMGMKRYETPRGVLRVSRSERVEVDADLLPKDYMVESVAYRPDKAAIKEAIARGEQVPGARIVERTNAVVK